MEQREFVWTAEPIQIVSLSQGKYQLIKEPFPREDIQLCYMVPYKSILGRLNTFQRGTAVCHCTVVLICAVHMALLYRRLLEPLNSLMKTMEKVGHRGTFLLRAGYAANSGTS